MDRNKPFPKNAHNKISITDFEYKTMVASRLNCDFMTD